MKAAFREVADWCGAKEKLLLSADGDMLLSGVSTDTRTIKPGQLFVPLQGDNFDGHDYIQAARDAGAAAALWDSSVPLPPFDMPLIRVDNTLIALQALSVGYLQQLKAKIVAVTGSNGKTTTKDLVSSVLSTRYRVHKTEGNYNNHIGLPLTILSAPADTEVLVLEMGMSGKGEIAALSKIAKPDIAIITNVGESHLLQLGSRSNIARAKLEITEGLPAGGQLVYYGDEPLLSEQLAAMKLPDGVTAVTFGEKPGNDWIARDIRVTAEETLFSVHGEASGDYELPVPGRHNAINALAAIVVGRLFHLSKEEISAGLKALKLTGMRIERSFASNGAVILNDAYNASPTSVKAAINLVEQLSGYNRKWIVLGDMLELGPDEAAFHAAIGRYLTVSKADRVLIFGPLSEHTYREAKSNYPDGHVLYFKDKGMLIEELLKQLAPEDLVLVKASRGIRLEEIVTALQRGARG
ncbi:UDP-N-acetylmuramoyl-tripeptide--D-alanyl-D-alanine ligase [Cohnella sp.]|uniref:UDP-N-acetylmuramoyl-tripeptide--D-alanyl-D- alanine ligase n=1 Tax=Cohnella sp. TaxID=1883426 RepID=UPI003564C9BD